MLPPSRLPIAASPRRDTFQPWASRGFAGAISPMRTGRGQNRSPLLTRLSRVVILETKTLSAELSALGPEEAVHADLYRPLAQTSFPLLGFVVRTAGDPAMLLKTAEQAIWDVDKDQPVFDAMPMRML